VHESKDFLKQFLKTEPRCP